MNLFSTSKHRAGNLLFKGFLLACVSTLSACALSPQYVNVDPEIAVSERVMPSQTVQLTIEDGRSRQELGTRGGVYKDTSYIYLNKPISESLRPKALQALSDLGLDTQGQSPVPVMVNIRLDNLSYTMNDESLPKKVALKASIHLSASKGSQQHEGQFNSAKEYSYMKAPSDAENEKIINEILSDTLTRLFNDPRFLDFIRQ